MESNDIFSPMAVHRCVYPSFEKVILIYPQIGKHGFPQEGHDLVMKLEGTNQIDGYNPFISPCMIKTVMEKGMRELLINLFQVQFMNKQTLLVDVNITSTNKFAILFSEYIPDLNLTVRDFWFRKYLIFREIEDLQKIG